MISYREAKINSMAGHMVREFEEGTKIICLFKADSYEKGNVSIWQLYGDLSVNYPYCV